MERRSDERPDDGRYAFNDSETSYCQTGNMITRPYYSMLTQVGG
jgi:hypothetical protein